MPTKSYTKKRTRPTGRVTSDEKMKMKIMDDAGFSKTEICEATGRGFKAVKRGIKDFEILLVGDSGLWDKFEEERDKFLATMVHNAATIMVAADHQVAKKLPESTAIEAAKISQIYANRLDGMVNLSKGGLNGRDGEGSVIVNNYINKIFNVIQNDRPKAISGTETRIDVDEDRGSVGDDEKVM